MSRRPKGDRAGSPFEAGAHVAVELTCPANHLIVRVGRNLDPRAEQAPYFEHPTPAAGADRVSRTRTWAEWDADTDPTRLAARCFSCGTEDRYRVERIRAVLDHLHARGEPVDLRLTKARFDDVSRRLDRP